MKDLIKIIIGILGILIGGMSLANESLNGDYQKNRLKKQHESRDQQNLNAIAITKSLLKKGASEPAIYPINYFNRNTWTLQKNNFIFGMGSHW